MMFLNGQQVEFRPWVVAILGLFLRQQSSQPLQCIQKSDPDRLRKAYELAYAQGQQLMSSLPVHEHIQSKDGAV